MKTTFLQWTYKIGFFVVCALKIEIEDILTFQWISDASMQTEELNAFLDQCIGTAVAKKKRNKKENDVKEKARQVCFTMWNSNKETIQYVMRKENVWFLFHIYFFTARINMQRGLCQKEHRMIKRLNSVRQAQERKKENDNNNKKI